MASFTQGRRTSSQAWRETRCRYVAQYVDAPMQGASARHLEAEMGGREGGSRQPNASMYVLHVHLAMPAARCSPRQKRRQGREASREPRQNRPGRRGDRKRQVRAPGRAREAGEFVLDGEVKSGVLVSDVQDGQRGLHGAAPVPFAAAVQRRETQDWVSFPAATAQSSHADPQEESAATLYPRLSDRMGRVVGCTPHTQSTRLPWSHRVTVVQKRGWQ